MSPTRRAFCLSTLLAPAMGLFVEEPGRSAGREPRGRSSRVNYMLRYYIRSETAAQQTEGLISNCRENHIPHVILFSGNHWDMGWNMPKIDEAKARVNILRPVVEQLRSAGLQVSINMWSTLGHGDIGRDERGRFSWQFMVGDDGTESHAIPCPIDPEWKRHVSQLYGLFAELEPAIIYIDDDFRLHNHLPVAWGCFCPLHLAEFARRTGRNLSRQELVQRVLTAEPQPTRERVEWLRLSGDTMLDAARIISDSVKQTSPGTRMGLMCSDPNVHAAEGRPWLAMLQAFSVSGHQPVLRPHYASYNDGVYRNAAREICMMRKLQPLLGGKMLFTPELENAPGTRFAKSVQLTRMQTALSFLLAPPDITLDIHSFDDTTFNYDPAVDVMLRNSFDSFNGVADWALECQKERGLQVLWDDRFPLHRKVEVSRMTSLPAPPCWEGAMDLFGFATTFYPGEVKLASRSYLEERSDDEIRSILKGKVLLDGDSAAHLVKRGFGREIGLANCEPVAGANYEEMTNKAFAGKYWNQDETTVEAHKYRLDPAEQAIVVTRMFGPDRSFNVPGMTLFANASGGRIGIVPQSGGHGDLYMVEFRGWKRQVALKKMLEWINQGPLPLFVEDAPNVFPIRRDGEKAVLLGIGNLSVDPLLRVRFEIANPFEGEPRIEYLAADGRPAHLAAQMSLRGRSLYVQTPVRIEPLSLGCFRLAWA